MLDRNNCSIEFQTKKQIMEAAGKEHAEKKKMV